MTPPLPGGPLPHCPHSDVATPPSSMFLHSILWELSKHPISSVPWGAWTHTHMLFLSLQDISQVKGAPKPLTSGSRPALWQTFPSTGVSCRKRPFDRLKLHPTPPNSHICLSLMLVCAYFRVLGRRGTIWQSRYLGIRSRFSSGVWCVWLCVSVSVFGRFSMYPVKVIHSGKSLLY